MFETPDRRRMALVFTLLGVSGLAQAQSVGPMCKVRGSREWLAHRGSPFDSASVVIGGQTAKICYSRPSARGLVPYDTMWRTGANEPTILHLTFAAAVAGVRLQPGRYLLFTVPRPKSWIIAFYTAQSDDPGEMFRTMSPVGQGTATAEQLENPIETFTIGGTEEADRGQFLLEWEHVRVRIPVTFIS
jgi:hypothetical protein